MKQEAPTSCPTVATSYGQLPTVFVDEVSACRMQSRSANSTRHILGSAGNARESTSSNSTAVDEPKMSPLSAPQSTPTMNGPSPIVSHARIGGTATDKAGLPPAIPHKTPPSDRMAISTSRPNSRLQSGPSLHSILMRRRLHAHALAINSEQRHPRKKVHEPVLIDKPRDRSPWPPTSYSLPTASLMYDDHPFSQWLQPALGENDSPISPASSSSGSSFASYRPSTVPQPSIYGALPYPTHNPRPAFMTFRFTALEASISEGGLLNASVTGPPNAKTYYRIRTDAPAEGFTVVAQAGSNAPVAVIQWSGDGIISGPVVEVKGVVSKRLTREWLSLSPEKSYRTMLARERSFVWVPEGAHISLYTAGLRLPQMFGRISSEAETGALRLEITAEAIQIGLLEVCVVSAILLQSGRRID
ncbi:hypothetical protein MIND_00413600 [Mycena indigotica]|uniref:DUF6593 domain-containing protein n=1 Tax=Mycena indigotica TaxID=2126181 RepID=A0A8H6SU61_9AGAR|nr:uncharacterized protein MIND_00413600 [Mycena indigotica]KAF7306230.1 hypothetical protein MIND_00413600 [Mycena indigotica]